MYFGDEVIIMAMRKVAVGKALCENQDRYDWRERFPSYKQIGILKKNPAPAFVPIQQAESFL